MARLAALMLRAAHLITKKAITSIDTAKTPKTTSKVKSSTPQCREAPEPAWKGVSPTEGYRCSDTPLGDASQVSTSTLETSGRAPSVLEKLRGAGTARPNVDPELAGGLRDWLEDSLAKPVSEIRAGSRPIRIGRAPLNRRTSQTVNPRDLATTHLMRCLFRQWITTGRFEDPIADAMAGLEAFGDPAGVVKAISDMSAGARTELGTRVSDQAARISRTFPALNPSWFPRTGERLSVPICGGRIVLAGIVDLVVGPQAAENATVCLVELTTSQGVAENDALLDFYALLETLRSGAPPSRVATFSSLDGSLRVRPVDEHLLVSALLTTVEVVTRICREREESQKKGTSEQIERL